MRLAWLVVAGFGGGCFAAFRPGLGGLLDYLRRCRSCGQGFRRCSESFGGLYSVRLKYCRYALGFWGVKSCADAFLTVAALGGLLGVVIGLGAFSLLLRRGVFLARLGVGYSYFFHFVGVLLLPSVGLLFAF